MITVKSDVADSRMDSETSKKMSSSPAVRYRHVEAVHSTLRNSCLSQDCDISPNFLGFRNLMVLVLGKWRSTIEFSEASCQLIPSIVVMNLRLVVENFIKVRRRGPSNIRPDLKIGFSTEF